MNIAYLTMKIPTLSTLVLLCFNLSCLAQDTTWFDGFNKITNHENGKSYGVRVKLDTGWRMTRYYMSGKIESIGLYSDDSCKIAQGEMTRYTYSGILHRRTNYKDGKETGNDIYYYDNGKMQAYGTNREGKPHGVWAAWYPSGKPAGVAKFVNGRQDSSSFFNEDGSVRSNVDSFFRESEYRGGNAGIYRYLGKHIKYPPSAFMNNIQGTVLFEFMVNTEGKMEDLRIINHSDKSLEAEAFRVVQELSDWEPALIGGVPIVSYKKLPVVFRL